jgi:RNA polymerase sigma-70 factor (ECF subfamily)
MSGEPFQERLSRIATEWTMLFQAHAPAADEATAAQGVLLQRYAGAVYRYLLGAVRDPDAAGELAQEFALRFLRGDFRRADPQRGRFRDYLKTALVHLVNDYHRSRQAWPAQLPSQVEPVAPLLEEADEESHFLTSWREDLLDRTWKALDRAQPLYHAVLLFRVENPDVPSAQMAEQLGAQLGRPLNAASVRKALQRGHEKFADLLIDELAASLTAPSLQELHDELQTLDLLRYCRSALERRGLAG